MPASRPTPERLLQLAQQLPASSRILLLLSNLMDSGDCSLEEIALLLRRDATLAARIIRISNGAVYGSDGGIASVEDAVGRVGFAEVYRLTGLAAAAQLVDEHLAFYGHTGGELRDNTLVTALAVEALARHARQDPRTAYAAALLRSIGKLVLDRFAKQSLSPAQHYTRSGKPRLIAWETGLLGCTNAEAAAIILESWHFPSAITEPIKQHYLLEPPDGPHARLTFLLNLASGVACDLGYSLPGEANYWEITPEKVEAAGLRGIDLAAIRDEAGEAFAVMRDSL